MENAGKKRKERGSLIFPLLIVAAGILFLLDNLGLLSGDAWDVIASFWPVFIIAVGLDKLIRNRGLAGAVLLIGLGSLFLLSNFGLLIWNVWDILWRFWPLLIVSAGLDLIFSGRGWWVSMLSGLLILAVFAGAVWIAGFEPMRGQLLRDVDIRYELSDDIRHAEISLSPAIGNVYLGESSNSNELIAGKISAEESGQIWKEFSIQNDVAVFNLESRSVWVTLGSSQWRWDLNLTREIPLKIHLDMAAGGVNLLLQDIILRELELSQGVGEINLSIPDQGNPDVDIRQAIGQIIVEIPKGVDVRIEVDKALSNLSLPTDFKRIGDSYLSSGNDPTERSVSLQINQAIGNIVVKYADEP
jgi:hypothetical protein